MSIFGYYKSKDLFTGKVPLLELILS